MAVQALRFEIEQGAISDFASEEHPAIRPAEVEEEIPTRGLTLADLTLNSDFDANWIQRVLRRKAENEVYVVTQAMDASGSAPVLWPPAGGDEETFKRAFIRMRRGETHAFALGDGAPLFPVGRPVGGIAVTIIVAESDHALRKVAKAINEASAELNSDTDLLDFLKKLVTNPQKIAVDVALGALARATEIVAKAVQDNSDENAGLFRGYYSAIGDWSGKLHEDQKGASITLREVR